MMQFFSLFVLVTGGETDKHASSDDDSSEDEDDLEEFHRVRKGKEKKKKKKLVKGHNDVKIKVIIIRLHFSDYCVGICHCAHFS